MKKAKYTTERQCAVIRQKVIALAEMQSKLEERLATFKGWLDQIDEALKAESKARARTKAKV